MASWMVSFKGHYKQYNFRNSVVCSQRNSKDKPLREDNILAWKGIWLGGKLKWKGNKLKAKWQN